MLKVCSTNKMTMDIQKKRNKTNVKSLINKENSIGHLEEKIEKILKCREK